MQGQDSLYPLVLQAYFCKARGIMIKKSDKKDQPKNKSTEPKDHDLWLDLVPKKKKKKKYWRKNNASS